MVVEFTGCSGAGKTSLVRRVRKLLREQNVAVVDPMESVLGSWIGRRLAASVRNVCESTRAQHAVVELLGWPATWRAVRRHAACNRLMRAWIRTVSSSRSEWLRLTRSLNRKLAVSSYWRHFHRHHQIFLQDEGTVHFAAILLARWPDHASHTLDQYLAAAPLPTCLVHVDAPQARCAARLVQRSVKPAPDRDEAERAAFMNRLSDMILSIGKHPRLAPRLIQVTNDRDDPMQLDVVAHCIAERLVNWSRRLTIA